MDVFDLAAKIRLDTTEYDKGLGEAERQTNSFASRIGSGLASLGKTIGVAMAGAATALGVGATALTKQATSSYAQYEQLVGGVETLFQTSSDKIMEYADKAYATAGLSANEYMQTVTSFAASLVQSAGRGEQQDTEMLEAELEGQLKATKRALSDEYDAVKENWDKRVKAAKNNEEKAILREQRDSELKALKRANEDKLDEMKAYNKKRVEEVEASNSASVTTEESLERAAKLANMAIIDMSDNANKMGTSMESIQNAYQGFAKQNYTMLDNLKLGYGGTKGEMERLLRDAEKISGIKYNVASYADIVEAIHLIQTQMGISGLTAEDAAEMVANGAMTQEEAYAKLGTTAKEAEGTIEGSAKAVKASWNNIITGLANGNADIGKLVDVFIANVEKSAENLLPTIERAVNGVVKLAGSMIEKAPELINKFLPTITNTIMSLTKSISKALPSLIKSGSMLISALIDGILDNSDEILDAIGEVIDYLVNSLAEGLPRILDKGTDVIIKIVDGITKGLPKILPAISKIINNLYDGITRNLPRLIEAGGKLLDGILSALTSSNSISDIISTVIKFVSTIGGAILKQIPNLVKTISQALPQIIAGLVMIIGKVVDELPTIIKGLLDALPDVIDSIIGAITDNMEGIVAGLITIFDKIIEKAPEILKGIVDNADKIINAVINGITDNLDDLVEGATSIISKLATFISDNASDIGKNVSDIITALVTAITNPETLTDLLKAAVSIMIAIADGFVNIVTNPEVWAALIKAAGNITKAIWDGLKNIVTSIWNIGEYIFDQILVGFGFKDAKEVGKKWGENYLTGWAEAVREKNSKNRGWKNTDWENSKNVALDFGKAIGDETWLLARKAIGAYDKDARYATEEEIEAGQYKKYNHGGGYDYIYDPNPEGTFKLDVGGRTWSGASSHFGSDDTESTSGEAGNASPVSVVLELNKSILGKVTYAQQKIASAIAGKELVNVVR